MIDLALNRAILALGVGIEEDQAFEALTTGSNPVPSDVAHLAIQAAKLYFACLARTSP